MYLRRCIPARIRRALNELPETLDETYARALKEIDKPNREYAHRIFQCVAAASRPFRVEELADFLAFDFEAGAIPTFLADWRPEDPTHCVLSTCSSLLAVVEDSPSRDGDTLVIPPDMGSARGSPATPPQVYQPPIPMDDDEIYVPHEPDYPTRTPMKSPPLAAQFAHFSVKEYLTSARLAGEKDAISRFHVSMTPAHTIIAQACLGVLLHLDENITNETLKEFPLAEYAAENWVDHARFENVAPNVLDGMKRLFDPSKNHFSVWVWIYDPESPQSRWGRSVRPVAPRARPLHYAAFCGMHDIAEFLIVERSQDVNARGFDQQETPLQVAVRRGHVEVARVLLKHGADTETRDKDDRTPLLSATQNRHVELARLLLEHGAYTEVREKDAYDIFAARSTSALEWAAGLGHVELVQALLEHGADVNAQKEWATPLHWASAQGHPAVARVLLSYGANLRARCKGHPTPLHCAKEEEVTRLLLEQGADANALEYRNRTPLHIVSEKGNVGAARVLLEHGVDANARDVNNATPLHLASDSVYRPKKGGEHILVVLLLIQYGSDINARDDKGRTPFMRATQRRLVHS